MKRFGITLLALSLLMLPATLTFAQPDVMSVEATTQNDLVSIDDFILTLDGDIEVLEADHTYVYTLNEQTIMIDLTEGYSLVNDQAEPYLLVPSELDETILNVVWFMPQLIEDEIWVPIQFIERVFNATFDNEKEVFILQEAIEIEEEVVTPPTSSPTPIVPSPKPQEEPEEVEPTPPPSTPVTPPAPSKPEEPKPPIIEEPETPAPPVEEPETPTPPVEEPEIPDQEEPMPPVEEPETPEEPVDPTPPPVEEPSVPTPEEITPTE